MTRLQLGGEQKLRLHEFARIAELVFGPCNDAAIG